MYNILMISELIISDRTDSCELSEEKYGLEYFQSNSLVLGRFGP